MSSWFHFCRAPLSHKLKKGDGIFVHFVLPGIVDQMYEGSPLVLSEWFSVVFFYQVIFMVYSHCTGTGRGLVQAPNGKY